MLLKTLLAAAVAAGTAYAQNNMSLTDAISSNDNLTALNSLLQMYPDFASQLANRTNVTVFAPNNQALQSLLPSNMSSSSNMSMNASLTEQDVMALLNYHVLIAEYTSDNFSSQPIFVSTYLNDSDYTQVTTGQVVELRLMDDDAATLISGLGRESTVVTADVMYDNGVVHIIDSVLTIPPSLGDTVRGRLDLLNDALELTGLYDTVASLTDITVFAPNNSAFMAIGSVLDTNSTTQLEGILSDILTYHVTNQSIFYSTTLTGNDTITMLDNETATVIITDDGAICIDQACVVIADILISNGVCHVIDSVLNPNNTDVQPSTDGSDEVVLAYSGATSATVNLPSVTDQPTGISSGGPALTSPETNPASDYTNMPSTAGENPDAGPTSTGLAGHNVIPTAAVGAAALFGAGAYLANL